MPLMKSQDFNGRDLPYSVKLQLVEQNCQGCPFFVQVDDEEIVVDGVKMSEPNYGCNYSRDLEQFNLVLRESYLTVSEIASNTCEFWNFWQRYQRVIEDWTPDDWNDFCAQPSELTYIIDTIVYKQVEGRLPGITMPETVSQRPFIPILNFASDCGVRY